MLKILTVVGARPQFIKAAMFSKSVAENKDKVNEVIVHTGQHFDADMSDIFFEELGIPKPNYNLGIGGGTHGQNTGRMLERIEEILLLEKPDWVLVYGDTDSTLAGALAAVKLHIPVVHVEAGLRSFNRQMPEEINRILTDHVATLLLVPTGIAFENLLKEGVDSSKIFNVGDIMYDASLFYKKIARAPKWFAESTMEIGKFALCTIHRAENTNDENRLKNIFNNLASCGASVVIPLHPRTKQRIKALNIEMPENILIVDPLGYLEMVWLESNCQFVITDSGGVQKEAFFHSKVCLTLREETEWKELVDSGWNFLVSDSTWSVSDFSMLSDKERPDFYGQGDTADKIFKLMIEQ